MGEARRRGDLGQRRAQAFERDAALRAQQEALRERNAVERAAWWEGLTEEQRESVRRTERHRQNRRRDLATLVGLSMSASGYDLLFAEEDS